MLNKAQANFLAQSQHEGPPAGVPGAAEAGTNNSSGYQLLQCCYSG